MMRLSFLLTCACRCYAAGTGGETRDPSNDEFRLMAQKTVELYNMTANQWVYMPSLPVGRFRCVCQQVEV